MSITLRSLIIIISIFLISTVNSQFKYGVSSGEVTDTSVILWTRTEEATSIRVQLSFQNSFVDIAQSVGPIETRQQNDFTIHVTVNNLQPNRRYFYRFLDEDNNASNTGKFKTAPSSDQSEDVHFVFTGDADGTRNEDGTPYFNNFEVMAKAAEEDPEFFMFIGDTIYADELGNGPDVAPTTLAGYRDVYKLNRGYNNYLDLLSTTSTYVQLDDHEVYDNWDKNSISEERLSGAYQAFTDYWTLRNYTKSLRSEGCIREPFFRYFKWGADVDVIVLDERTCRTGRQGLDVCQFSDNSTHLHPFPTTSVALKSNLKGRFGFLYNLFSGISDGIDFDLDEVDSVPDGCVDALNDPSRTMLGEKQKNEFLSLLKASTAKFKIILNELPIQEWFIDPYDRWEGYPAERREILQFIRNNSIDGVVFLTADVHINIITDVYIDTEDLSATPVAKELVVGPIAMETLVGVVEYMFPRSGTVLSPAVRDVFNDILDLVHPPYCRNLDTYSYGTAVYNSTSGEMTFTLKDKNGQVLIDETDDETRCEFTISPTETSARFPSTSSTIPLNSFVHLIVVFATLVFTISDHRIL
jgi:phosphodiesterase/alkaline phosphatase D-like protein